MKKRVLFETAIWGGTLNDMYKDTGLVHTFSKKYDYHAIFDDWCDLTHPELKQYKSIELLRYKHRGKFIKFKKILKVFRMAKNIDILYIYQITSDSGLKMLAYKLGGGKGKIFLKLDLSIVGYRDKFGNDLLVWKNMPVYLKIMHAVFKPLADVITVETKQAYERLKQTYYGDLIEKDKLFLLPNGVDPEMISSLVPKRLKVNEKEHLIITVGRLGTRQKNTELLLEILGNVTLNDWKVVLIGPVEDSFKDKINKFYQDHPSKKKMLFLPVSFLKRRNIVTIIVPEYFY